jgi:hypothetical protein
MYNNKMVVYVSIMLIIMGVFCKAIPLDEDSEDANLLDELFERDASPPAIYSFSINLD